MVFVILLVAWSAGAENDVTAGATTDFAQMVILAVKTVVDLIRLERGRAKVEILTRS